MSTIRIFKAPAGGGTMTRQEVEKFLSQGKLILRLATVNSQGDLELQPVWYHYSDGRLYLITGPNSRKVQNIRQKNTAYFSVDTEISPYKGVKGKGKAAPLADKDRAVMIAERIGVKYLGSAQHAVARKYIDEVREGKETVIEIVPEFFSVWD